MLKKGFTLIELLVVIAIMAIIAGAVLVAINPVDKINSANDAKAQADIGQIATAATTYAAANNGFYAPTSAALQTAGELTAVPTAPTGYTYTYTAAPASCTSTTCTSVVITTNLKSTKYVGYATWRFSSATGITCAWSGTACKP